MLHAKHPLLKKLKVDTLKHILVDSAVIYLSPNQVIYRSGVSRLDKISQQYYQTPFFGWLIMMANPQFGGLENNIYDGAMLKIPYPLETSLLDYKTAVETHFFYYGKWKRGY